MTFWAEYFYFKSLVVTKRIINGLDHPRMKHHIVTSIFKDNEKSILAPESVTFPSRSATDSPQCQRYGITSPKSQISPLKGFQKSFLKLSCLSIPGMDTKLGRQQLTFFPFQSKRTAVSSVW